ncbi:hypothetical protein [Muribaculum intestinale]|uniref:hypothetical protein n=1 Tax=Muribaculum intestinale TaxID=1796646 RepID=UPI003F675737
MTATGSVNGAEGTFHLQGRGKARRAKTIQSTYRIPLLHRADNDEMVKLVYDSSAQSGRRLVEQRFIQPQSCNDGWGGTQFKFKNNTNTLIRTANVVIIKQIKFTISQGQLHTRHYRLM